MERKGLELGVGVFLLVGMFCLAYVSLKLGDVQILGTSSYEVHAKFSNVAGLKEQAPVTIAGVNVGEVKAIQLAKGQADLTLSIEKGVKLEDDSIASIKTMGLIGDKYIAISPGASDDYIKPGGSIHDTQPPLDIENLLGRFVFGSVENKPKQE